MTTTLKSLQMGLLTALAIILSGSASASEDQPVVEILVSFQEYDTTLPWQHQPTKNRRGFGLMLNDSLVITTESLIRNQTLIEIRRPRSGRKEAARLIQADPQIDLALLSLGGATPRPPVTLSNLAEADNSASIANIVQVSDAGEPQAGNGRIVQWEVDNLPNAPYSVLLGTILTDLNIDGAGAPVYIEEHLAGITLNYDRNSRTALMLPGMFIKQFIDDVQSPPYQGFSSAGISWQPLIDDTKRAYFGIPETETGGIQVLGALSGENDENPLQPNDIILQIDATPIDSQGYYQDPIWGRLSFAHMIKGLHRPGDTIAITCIRNRKIITETVVLTRFDDNDLLIPENAEGRPEPYLVDGGLIIRELTGHMITAPGNKWTVRTDPRLAHLYLARQSNAAEPDQRVVILSRVLPDPINIAYQHLRDDVIETVNGTPVNNLRDVLAAVDREGGLRRMGLFGYGVDIALDPDTLQEANQRIARQYRIPTMRRDPVVTEITEEPRLPTEDFQDAADK